MQRSKRRRDRNPTNRSYTPPAGWNPEEVLQKEPLGAETNAKSSKPTLLSKSQTIDSPQVKKKRRLRFTDAEHQLKAGTQPPKSALMSEHEATNSSQPEAKRRLHFTDAEHKLKTDVKSPNFTLLSESKSTDLPQPKSKRRLHFTNAEQPLKVGTQPPKSALMGEHKTTDLPQPKSQRRLHFTEEEQQLKTDVKLPKPALLGKSENTEVPSLQKKRRLHFTDEEQLMDGEKMPFPKSSVQSDCKSSSFTERSTSNTTQEELSSSPQSGAKGVAQYTGNFLTEAVTRKAQRVAGNKLRQVEQQDLGVKTTSKMVQATAIIGGTVSRWLSKGGSAAVRYSGKKISKNAYEYAHAKANEMGEDELGVRVVHRGEQAAEAVFRGGRAIHRYRRSRKETRAARDGESGGRTTNTSTSAKTGTSTSSTTKTSATAKTDASASSGTTSAAKTAQKKAIKRRYATELYKAQKAGISTSGTVSAWNMSRAKIGAVVTKAFTSKTTIIVTAVVLGIVLLVLLLNLGLIAISSLLMSVAEDTFLSEDMTVTNADVYFTELETNLREKIASQQEDNPDADEYTFDGDITLIQHDSTLLIAYLTAKYQDFDLTPEIQLELDRIFALMYNLEQWEESNPDENQEEENLAENPDEPPPFTHHMKLTVTPLRDVLWGLLTEKERTHFEKLEESGGNWDSLRSPFSFDWRPYVTSQFGWRIDPFSGKKNYHTGLDIGVAGGTPILALEDGVVIKSEWHNLYGNLIGIQHADGTVSRYAHCQNRGVTVGQQVKRGDTIALVGTTGNSTGNHLHLEIYMNGDFVNPYFYIQKGTTA